VRKPLAALATMLAAAAALAALTVPAAAFTKGQPARGVNPPVATTMATPATAIPYETPPRIPDYQKYVNPKVTCGSFSGYVDWGGDGSIVWPYYLHVSGTVRSTCNSTTYVYIGYTRGTGSYEVRFGKTGPYSSKTVSWGQENRLFSYGHIYVDVCSNRYGWTCDKVYV
jgi:hypothetical protein